MRAGFSGQMIAQKVALQQVTIIKQQAVRACRPVPRDAAGHPRQPEGRTRLIRKIIVRKQMHVQIAGGEDAQFRTGRRRGGIFLPVHNDFFTVACDASQSKVVCGRRALAVAGQGAYGLECADEAGKGAYG